MFPVCYTTADPAVAGHVHKGAIAMAIERGVLDRLTEIVGKDSIFTEDEEGVLKEMGALDAVLDA